MYVSNVFLSSIWYFFELPEAALDVIRTRRHTARDTPHIERRHTAPTHRAPAHSAPTHRAPRADTP